MEDPNKNVSVFILAALVIIFIYLAFFGFDAEKAFIYTINQLKSLF